MYCIRQHVPQVRAGAHAAYRGNGPVSGVHRRRGGFGCFRRPQTQQERRWAAATLRAEGEPLPRPARNETNLRSAWDDILRPLQRCWKAQHSGRRAWDRPKMGSETKLGGTQFRL